MTSKSEKYTPFGSDKTNAKGAGGQQGSVLKGERAPQRDNVQYTDDELRAIGERARQLD